jgi:hypothetical protein
MPLMEMIGSREMSKKAIEAWNREWRDRMATATKTELSWEINTQCWFHALC